MPQMKVNNQYYTATQVKQKLGITHGQLYNYIRNGHLHSVIPPGKKQGVYLRSEVDELADELAAFFATRVKKEASTFERAKEKDLPEIVEISKRIFCAPREEPISLEIRTQWLKKNPETFYVLKHEGLIVGYNSILPLKQETIEKLIHGKIEPEEITYDLVEEFIPGKPLHLYIMAIGVDPRVNRTEKHTYGSRLIAGLIGQLVNLGSKGVIIETITARSHKPDGIRLLRKMGFPELQSPVPGKRLFVIKMEETGNPLITRYKEALKKWQEENNQTNAPKKGRQNNSASSPKTEREAALKTSL